MRLALSLSALEPRRTRPLTPSPSPTCSAQTNELGSEQRKAKSIFGSSAPVWVSTGRSPAISDVDSNDSSGSSREGSSTGGTAFQSTFKSLTHPSSVSDNVFDELETRRPTSWQFELHQRASSSLPLSLGVPLLDSS